MKKTTSILTFAAMLLSMTACGTNDSSEAEKATTNVTETMAATTIVETTEKPFDIEEFKKKISEFNDTVYTAGILLSNAGNYESNSIEIDHNFGDTPDPDEMYKNAVEWLIKKADPDMGMTETKIEDDYSAICKEYQDIKAADNCTQELSAVREAYEDLFNGYTALYNVVTNPPISSFTSKFNEQVDAVTEANSKLTAFLK